MGVRSYWKRLIESSAVDARAFGGTIASVDAGWGDSYGGYDGDDWGRETEAADYLRLSPAVYMATRYRSQKLASVPLQFKRVTKGGQKTLVTSGSLVEIMARVNPYWTAARLFEMTELSLCLRGVSYWLLDRGQGGGREPKEIWWINPDWIKPVRGGDYIKSFAFDTGSGRVEYLDPDEVVWFRYPNPANEFAGLSPLDAARIIADTGSAALTSNKKMFSQGMQLAGFVAPANANDTWTKEQGQEIESSLSKRFSGKGNAHRWAVLGRQMAFQALTVSPKDIEFIALLKWSFEDICRVFGLSPDLLGGERTYANAAEARLAFWQDTMGPECSFFANELTEQLLPLFPGQADVAEFDLSGIDVLQELEASKWAREKEQISAGAILVNAWRESKGLKPVPWGDDWWAPIGLNPVGGPMAAAAEQAAQQAADALAASVQDQQPPAVDAGAPVRAITSGRVRHRGVEYGSEAHQRIMRAFEERATKHEARIAAVTAELFRSQKKSILANLKNGRAHTRADKPIEEDPFDLARWTKQFRTTIKPVFAETVKDVGQATLGDLGLDIAFDVQDPNVLRFLAGRSQRFATELNATTYTQLQTSLSEGVDAGESIDDLAARVEAVMGDRIRSSATTIARTEVIGASNGGALLSAQQSEVVQGKTWLAALDERTRDTHIAAHNQTVRLNEDFVVGDGSGPHPGAIGVAAEDVNCRCFPGDTIVYAEDVYAASMRWYDGPLATVTLNDGRAITATPNHPVLTRRGWVAAGELNNADDLIGYRLSEDVITTNPYPDQRPTTFADTFRLLSASGRGKRVAGAVPDFHGDGSDNEVYVVRPEPNLRNGFVSSIGEPTAQDVFAESHDAERGLTTGDTRGPGGCAESLPLVSISVRHAEDHRLASRSRGDASIPEAKGYPVSANPEFIGKRLDGSALSESINDGRVIDRLASPEVWPSGQRFAGCSHRDASIGKPRVDDRGGNTHIIRDLDGGLTANVPADNRVNINGDGSPWSILPGMRLSERTTRDARCFEAIENGPSVTAKILRDGPCRFPGTVTFNNVVSVNVGPFRGHVYNLHTASGHYVADGIIAHNCVMTFVLDTEEMP